MTILVSCLMIFKAPVRPIMILKGATYRNQGSYEII